MKYFTTALAVIFTASNLSAQAQDTMTLEELLRYSDNALTVMQAEAEVEQDRHRLEKEQSDSGLSLFASAGYGRVRDVIDTNRTRDFNQALAKFGARYPLLGAAEAESRQIHEARGELAGSRSRMLAAKKLARLELEMNYARYWEAQEHLEVIDSYLASESKVSRILTLRRQQDLLLESQMQNLLSGYAKARVDQRRYQRQLDKARNRIQQLTGESIGKFEAGRAALAQIQNLSRQELIAGSPELQALQAKTNALRSKIDDSNWYGINADIEVSTSVVRDTTGAQTGGGLFAGVNVSAPLSFLSARKAAKQELKAERRKTRLEYREKSLALVTEAEDTRDKYKQYLQTIKYTEQRTQAAAESLREYTLRSGVMDNAGIEVLSQRLGNYYALSNRQIEAYADAWMTHIETRMFMPATDNVAASTPTQATGPDLGKKLSRPIEQLSRNLQGSTVSAKDNNWRVMPANYRSGFAGARTITADYKPSAHDNRLARRVTAQQSLNSGNELTVYLWDSEPILETMQYTDSFWNGLKDISVKRLFVSLNGSQIRQATTSPDKLETFLDKAAANGIEVELLLGEPTWIEPGNQDKLVGIIKALSNLDFAGVHLDIEPNQIYKLPLERQQFKNWIDTMAAAAKASPWPVGISVHHRYFHEAPYTNWNMGDALMDANINHATLMIYNARPESVAAIATPIIEQNPDINFSVAQSVETILSKKLSHHYRTPREFEQTMARLSEKLVGQKNFKGIVIQDWNNLLKIGYESKIL